MFSFFLKSGVLRNIPIKNLLYIFVAIAIATAYYFQISGFKNDIQDLINVKDNLLSENIKAKEINKKVILNYNELNKETKEIIKDKDNNIFELKKNNLKLTKQILQIKKEKKETIKQMEDLDLKEGFLILKKISEEIK